MTVLNDDIWRGFYPRKSLCVERANKNRLVCKPLKPYIEITMRMCRLTTTLRLSYKVNN